MRTIKAVLVPTDFSEASAQALEHACGLADTFGAALHLMHVVDDPFMRSGFAELYGALPPDYFDNLAKEARARLEALLTPGDAAKYSAVFITRVGLPAREILDYLTTHDDIDVVVMSTAGRGAVGRLLLGSVAEKIVRAAPCPVLIIHPRDRAESGAAPRAA
jgi:nucleotide-binding universal stress UspA family protein